MLDPLTAAVASLAEIRAMAEELFAADRKYIPEWCRKPERRAGKKKVTAKKKKPAKKQKESKASSMKARDDT